MVLCSVDGCADSAKLKGMCILHYKRVWRTGSPFVATPKLKRPTFIRFWFYVDKSTADQCWVWKGYKNKDGYGKLRDKKTNRGAHRVSWEMKNGEIPKGMFVLHKCNNPSCVNPGHLYLGNQLQNMKDRVTAGHYSTGEKHHNCKLSSGCVCLIKMASGTHRKIAKDFGISHSTVGYIKRNQSRKHG